MIVTTTSQIAGRRIARTLGLVRGNTVRARHIGRDIMAALRNVVGGEVIKLRIAIWDTSDGALDSLSIIDNFEWSVDASTPGTVIF